MSDERTPPTALAVFSECLAIIEELAPSERRRVTKAIGRVDSWSSSILDGPVDWESKARAWKTKSSKWKAQAEGLEARLDEALADLADFEDETVPDVSERE